MDQKNYSILLAFLLFSKTTLSFFCSQSIFVPRPQGTNAARRLAVADHQLPVDNICYAFWAIPEFTRSYRCKEIAKALFGCNQLVFSGSRVENRGKRDILADYFGLPSDFKSTVCFNPTITNFLFDVGFTFNLDWVRKGTRLQFYAPFVHTRWNLCLCEKIQQKGENFSPAGYLVGGNQRIDRSRLASDVKTAFRGCTTFGDMQDPLRYGKICGTQTKTEIAQACTRLFLELTSKEKYYCDASLMISAPTGTRVTAEYLFDPIVGANHHWQLGFGLHGLWQMWSDDYEDEQQKDWAGKSKLKPEKKEPVINRSCAFILDLNFSTLLPTQQRRSFDFKKAGRGSRYMLLSSMEQPRDDILQVPAGSSPEQQYIGHLFPAINKTTLCCDVYIPFQADLLFAFSYKRNSWTFYIGYNFWGRTQEKLRNRQRFESNKFALKGDAQLYGYFNPLVNNLDVAVPLNGTQSNATIYAGQADASGNYNTDFLNLNIDNPVNAREANTPGGLNQLTVDDAADLGIVQGNVQGSNPAVLLTDCDIDTCSALSPKASSSKLFFNSSWKLKRQENWEPFIGFGAEVEFGHSCQALSQFGAWLTFGALY